VEDGGSPESKRLRIDESSTNGFGFSVNKLGIIYLVFVFYSFFGWWKINSFGWFDCHEKWVLLKSWICFILLKSGGGGGFWWLCVVGNSQRKRFHRRPVSQVNMQGKKMKSRVLRMSKKRMIMIKMNEMQVTRRLIINHHNDNDTYMN
jgi:hypothetical protein